MSLNKFKAVSLKDKLDAQESDLVKEVAAVESELVAVKKEKKRAGKN